MTVAHPFRIALLVAGAFFMEFLDGTVITTALPDIARSLGTEAVALNVGLTAYLVTIAVLIPISGWVADRFGARQVFATAIFIFTLASVMCGLSVSLAMFIGARILQGVGAAMMVPVGRIVVLRNTEKKDLLRAIAYLTWPALTAPIVGPPIGGFITQTFSWRWIFFINVPLGALGLIATVLIIPIGHDAERRPFDLLGFVLTAAGTVCLLYGLDLAGSAHAAALPVAALLAAGVVLLGLAFTHMRRAATPLFALNVLKIPTFAVAVTGGSLFRIAVGSQPFLLPLFFQVGLGFDPLHSGLLVLAVFGGNLFMKVAANQTISRFGYKRVLIGNGLVCAFSIALCATLGSQTPSAIIFALLFVGGAVRSLQFSAVSTLNFADVAAPQMSGASAIVSMLQQLNAAFGVALGALVLHVAASFAGRSVPSAADFHVAFLATAGLALVAVLDCLTLSADAGHAVSGRRTESTPSAAADVQQSSTTRAEG